MTILPNLAQENEMLKAKLEQMNALLTKASQPRAITMKVTAPKLDPKTGEMVGSTGAISIYGLGRFPVTLYRSQLERFITEIPAVQAFIATNAHLLANK